ncbi:uncharacterized protein LOC143845810 [Tasmannia lanceolata]|uniref:uncharacterized protein LOC143845810 n=1 Tax=Tasmannia lanceolata TaxID=3420 RepID=UPI004063C71D
MANPISLLHKSFPPLFVSSSKPNPHLFPLLHSSQFLHSNPLPRSFNPIKFPSEKKLFTRFKTSPQAIVAAQSNLFKVLQTAWRVGKDGIEAGTNLVPDSVPRPIARISVAVVAVTVALFLLKSVLSTAFFVLAMMGFIYFVFIALNKDDGPSGGGGSKSSNSTDETLDEARRIMEKYK